MATTTLFLDSVLVVDKRYQIQDVSKFPKAKQYMINQHCVLKQIVGSTAHVMFTGRMTEVPVRSLIQVTGYYAKGVNYKNADGFVVVKQNSLGLQVGTAYLNHDKEKSNDEYIFVTVHGKDMKIPFDILSALVAVKKKEKPLKSEKIAEKTGLAPALVEVMAELDAPVGNREDDTDIPPAIVKLLPGVNLVELRDLIRTEEDVFFDYSGEAHKTIAECDKANTKLRYKRMKDRLMELTNKTLLGMWKK